MHAKDTEEIANSVDPDQTAPGGAVCSGVCTVFSELSILKLNMTEITFKGGKLQIIHCKPSHPPTCNMKYYMHYEFFSTSLFKQKKNLKCKNCKKKKIFYKMRVFE